jgi:molybdopterin molybdotransferase
MISFEKAMKTVLAHAPKLPPERIPLPEAVGRVLATDVCSDVAMPPCDVSAMDGFACRASDRDSPLTVIETIAAGKMPRKTVGPDQCSRIMTGAPVPKGADCVVMFEDTATDIKTGLVTIIHKQDNPNIRRAGEDVRRGDRVLRKGALLSPAHAAVLAAAGKAFVSVYRRSRVGIIATGDELVEPWVRPRKGQIRNSNGPQLCAQARAAGCHAVSYGIVPDDCGMLNRAIATALRQCDVVLLSGGVSMGDFDFVPGVLRKNRVRLLFEKIAIKPGKPTVFGIAGKKRLFGMPGNPVSSFVIFEMLVKPFLYKMAGHDYSRLTVGGVLARDLARKSSSRMEFRPVRFDDSGKVSLSEYHGSAHIHAYTQARGILAIPAGVERIKAGAAVEVKILRQP